MPFGEEFIYLALILGILIAILVSLVGLGGGILIIPVCIFILGFSPKDAIVISLFSMTFLTISATINYMRKSMVNYRLAFLYNIFDTPGVILGAFLTLFIVGNIIAGIAGIIILMLSITLFTKKDKFTDCMETLEDSADPESCENLSKYGVDNIYLASLSSFSGGFVAGFVGLGGGTTDTTSMILLGLDPKKAAATSEFGMVFTSIIGLTVHLIIGTYTGSWLWPIMLSIGTVIGAQVGPFLNHRVRINLIRKILAGLTFYTGILMILLMFGIGWIG